MRWRQLKGSSNVDDLRGRRVRRAGIPLRIGRGRGGIAVIAVLVVAYLVGGPEMLSLFLGGETTVSSDGPATANPFANDEVGQFVGAVLASTEDEWGRIFSAAGREYSEPRLTLFSGAVESACGFTTSAAGPFYCPPDQRVYLDTTFFDELAQMGGAGDFAQAYVIGHEVGHHVQNLLGTAAEVRNAQSRTDQTGANRLQVAMELQADCYAGVWANHANRSVALLEPGDVDEGLAAAAAIGDDRLQRSAGRRVVPDAFTHGSSAERQRWLGTGLQNGELAACDTFQGL